MNMPLKVKIIHISIYYLMYSNYDKALNLDIAFLLSVNICICNNKICKIFLTKVLSPSEPPQTVEWPW